LRPSEENVLLKAEPPFAAPRRRWLNPGRRGLGLILALAVLLTSHAAGSAASRARVSAPDGLNLRDAPSLSANVVTLLPYGMALDVLSAPGDDNWYQVNATGRLGYVKGDYLDFSAPAPLRGDAVVTPSDGLRLRAAASTSADVVATLPSGRVVHIVGDPTADGWYQVQATEGSGWVDGSYLQAATTGATPIMIRWYGHEFDGGVLACGGVFNADDPGVAATNGFPCGTHLRACWNGRCVTVVVRDRGHMGAGAMDLSAAAFQRLTSLDAGMVQGTVQPTNDDPAPLLPPPPPPPGH
jgi:uncharacterized protein YraI